MASFCISTLHISFSQSHIDGLVTHDGGISAICRK